MASNESTSRRAEPSKGAARGPVAAGGHSRFRIGILVSELRDEYQAALVEGAGEEALRRGLQLRCFVGGELESERPGDALRNRIYELVGGDSVDAIVIMSGALANSCGSDRLAEYCKRFAGLPMCTISGDLPGLPNIIADNESGVRSAVSHLVNIHERRRIGFICGPPANQDAQERYLAYVKGLAEHGIVLDERRIAPGNFSSESGIAAIASLFDERKLTAVDIDSIITADDSTALGALSELTRRRIAVPRQMAVVGFDDIEDARFSSPPLSTVRQPLHEQGARAIRLLHERIKGSPPGDLRVVLSTIGTFRRSCGCYGGLPPGSGQAKAAPLSASFEVELLTRREAMRDELVRATRGTFGASLNWDVTLITTFAEQLRAAGSDRFSAAFASMAETLVASGTDAAAIHLVVSLLRQQMLACLSRNDEQLRARAEDIFQEARLVACEAAERFQAHRRARVEQAATLLGRTVRRLLAASSTAELATVLSEQLRTLGIGACYVSVFEGPSPSRDVSRLIIAYDATVAPTGRVEDERFMSRHLAPARYLDSSAAQALAALPLQFGGRHLGTVVMAYGNTAPDVYEILADTIGAVVHHTCAQFASS